jgi:beta-glucanase (GH16 family)
VTQNSFLKKLSFASLMLAATVVSVLMGPQRANAESFKLKWSTDFNSTLSTAEWNIYNKTPFGSSQNACFMATNAYAKNGYLNLVINPNKYGGCSGRPYASGGLDTYKYQSQTYGRWEVRAKMAKGYGAVGYIGLFTVNGSWPPEVDIAELIGKEPQNIYQTQHYGTWPNNQQQGAIVALPGVDWTAAYHTYTLDWVPGQLRYYIDGVLQMTQAQQFSTESSAMMKLAIGTGTGNCGSWFDCPSAAATNGAQTWTSTTMSVDYVKIYQYVP